MGDATKPFHKKKMQLVNFYKTVKHWNLTRFDEVRNKTSSVLLTYHNAACKAWAD